MKLTPLFPSLPLGVSIRASPEPLLPPCFPESYSFLVCEVRLGHLIVLDQVIECGDIFPLNGCEKRCHWYHNDSSFPQLAFDLPLVAGATPTTPARQSV